jgi:hypothetical protein
MNHVVRYLKKEPDERFGPFPLQRPSNQPPRELVKHRVSASRLVHREIHLAPGLEDAEILSERSQGVVCVVDYAVRDNNIGSSVCKGKM